METSSEIVAIIDADNSYNIDQLIDLMKEFENNKFDLIVEKETLNIKTFFKSYI